MMEYYLIIFFPFCFTCFNSIFRYFFSTLTCWYQQCVNFYFSQFISLKIIVFLPRIASKSQLRLLNQKFLLLLWHTCNFKIIFSDPFLRQMYMYYDSKLIFNSHLANNVTQSPCFKRKHLQKKCLRHINAPLVQHSKEFHIHNKVLIGT